MIRFLIGRTGSGKTQAVINKMKSLISTHDKKIYFFVPEQQLYSVEREILSAIPPQDAKYLVITSFTKIADDIEDQYGGRAHLVLSHASNALLMWMNLRELSGLFETYQAVPTGDISLTRKMLDVSKELAVNGISPLKLENVANLLPADSPLKGKLRDISLVVASHQRLLDEMCGQNPSDRLIRVCEKADKHDFFTNTMVFVDSFTSFTYQEYAMLSLMFAQSDEVTVTLSMDSLANDEPHLASLKDTYRKIAKIADALDQDITVEAISKPTAETELAYLEKNLWCFDAEPFKNPISDHPQIKLYEAPNPYDEALAAALHIIDIVQSGVPYGRIAVVVRDMSKWKGILDEAFEQYRIPYFISEKTDLNTKPAARLLYLALKCISRHYQLSDIMSLCKTGLCGVSMTEIDAFEEYTQTWHLSGKRMTDEIWNMNPDGYTTDWSRRGKDILDSANHVKDTVMRPLMTLEVKLKGAKDLTEQCRALYEYLCDLSVREQLSAQGKIYLELGDVREAGEAVRLWSFLNEALATLATVSSTVNEESAILTPEELSNALSLLYTETDIGSVPAKHDCVIIGTADTLRVENTEVSLLLGLCEGEFPAPVNDTGLLSEQEKQFLYDAGLEFSSRESLLNANELFYVHRAMAKPSSALYLSRSLTGTDGKELSSSIAFVRVQKLFPYLKITAFSSSMLQTDENRYTPVSQDSISKERAYALLGEEMWLSKSKLQRYAACPYSYYGSYILKLRERVEAKVDHLTSGLFLHHVLEVFLKHAIGHDGRPKPFSDEEINQTVDEIIEAYVRSINTSALICQQGRFLHTFERLRAIALVLVKDILAELKQGSFTPIGFEWDTHGYQPDDPLPLMIPIVSNADDIELPVGISKGKPVLLKMGGVIDRVDVYRSDEQKTVYIRVVDYKSSKHGLDEKTLTEDMDVQLLLYLFTLCAENNRHLFADADGSLPEAVLPAEAMYLSPKEDSDTGEITSVRSGLILDDEEIIRAATHERDTTFLPDGLKVAKDGSIAGKALCTKARMQELENLLRKTIAEQGEMMYQGKANKTPSPDGCKFCRVRESCPLSADIKGY